MALQASDLDAAARTPTPNDTRNEARIRRLSSASVKRVIEPDVELEGQVGPGQVIPDELLSIAGLDIDLTPEQRAVLSREEVASMLDSGIRFEAALEAGMALELFRAEHLVDPRHTYLLHEMGEETRHQRVFLRLYEQLAPTAVNPLATRFARWALRRVTLRLVQSPAAFYTLILAGEEIPDLLQQLSSEHPDTDRFLAAVNRYHRLEEARHLSFARVRLAELWPTASRVDRFRVRHVVPYIIDVMFGQLVHPGVYRTVGLPAMATWKAVNRSPRRRELKAAAVQPVLDAVISAGAIHHAIAPRAWRRLVEV